MAPTCGKASDVCAAACSADGVSRSPVGNPLDGTDSEQTMDTILIPAWDEPEDLFLLPSPR